jgi:hypothetical protein
MRWVSVMLLIGSVACTEGRSSGAARDSAIGREMVGVWDATMRVNHPYPLQLRSSDAVEICGMIGLVENHASNTAADDIGAATQLGVYDLPLSRLGLEWNGLASFPAATVSTGIDSGIGSSATVRDSVRIVLNPGSEERIVLSGRYEANGIHGTWTAQSARGTATGTFSMRQHNNSRLESSRC